MTQKKKKKRIVELNQTGNIEDDDEEEPDNEEDGDIFNTKVWKMENILTDIKKFAEYKVDS